MSEPSEGVCATAGCPGAPAFKTRTRPAWCTPCLKRIFADAGLRALEAPKKYGEYTLTECTECGCQADYRLEYVLEKRDLGIGVCQACFWRDWARSQRDRTFGDPSGGPVANVADIRQRVEQGGLNYLGPLTSPSLEDDPHRVRCPVCGKITVGRLGDIAGGCSCSRNPKGSFRAGAPKEYLAGSNSPALAWWDHDRNDPNILATVTVLARQAVWWRCPTCSVGFQRSVNDMARNGRPDCPECSKRRGLEFEREREYWSAVPVSEMPELLARWADEADPRTAMVYQPGSRRRFRCEYGHFDTRDPLSYLRGGCTSCNAAATRADQSNPRLAAASPEIAEQWHPSKNAPRTPESVPASSKRRVRWRDPRCGHEWVATVVSRDKYDRYRCPQCRTVLGSLAYTFPDLAAEWSDENPLSAWHVRPFGKLEFLPTWQCTNDHSHVWAALLTSRSTGAGCPECRTHGKSKVEVDHHKAAERAFGNAKSGAIVRADEFKRRPAWTVDILVPDSDSTGLVIEYDGAYWHADKPEIDRHKTMDLLSAGYRVARLREYPLESLDIADDRYFETTVHATAVRPDEVIGLVRAWATSAKTRAK